MRPELAAKYAAKWRADGHGGEEPTDDALREALSVCVRPPRGSELPAIRDAILTHERGHGFYVVNTDTGERVDGPHDTPEAAEAAMYRIAPVTVPWDGVEHPYAVEEVAR